MVKLNAAICLLERRNKTKLYLNNYNYIYIPYRQNRLNCTILQSYITKYVSARFLHISVICHTDCQEQVLITDRGSVPEGKLFDFLGRHNIK